MTFLSERIQSIIHELAVSQSEFARKIGTSVTYVNLIINKKRRKISHLMAYSVEQKYGYSAYWILTGEGEKRSLEDYYEISDIIDHLPAAELQLVYEYVQSLKKKQNISHSY
jgi:transcriptional regulator with XRE-family HTH domain